MTHVYISDGDGVWAVAVDGGRKRVLGLFPSAYAGEDALSREEVEAIALLIALALDTPGGVKNAIRSIMKDYTDE